MVDPYKCDWKDIVEYMRQDLSVISNLRIQLMQPGILWADNRIRQLEEAVEWAKTKGFSYAMAIVPFSGKEAINEMIYELCRKAGIDPDTKEG